MTPVDLENRLKESFPDAEVVATDLTGGGDHWQVKIVSGKFAGKTMVEQHQLVYQALGNLMDGAIHALSLQTSAPT